MKLDIVKIENQVGCTPEEIAVELQITLEELLRCCDDNAEPMSQTLLERICSYTGLGPYAGGIFVEENTNTFNPKLIQPEDTFKSSREARTSLIEYIKQGLQEIKEPLVNNEIKLVENCVKALRKPKISFAGQSDTGKSTLINMLLGAEKMPAKWTPTTSIVVYIKHVDDRPDFMTDDVWIFGENANEEWDDTKLFDQELCNKFMIAKGDFSLLNTFGTHQNENDANKIASSAVAFIDSPLLKNCDILDLPGFAANLKDDALHKFNTQDNVTDILLYLSRANGFLQDRDLDYLRECLKSLRPVEQNGVNDMDKLENLFILASQSGAINNGNFNELKEILDKRCAVLCNIYRNPADQSHQHTLLNTRTQLTGYEYHEPDFRARFFTYEKDINRLCKNFNMAFTTLVEKLPKAMYNEFAQNLKSIIECSKTKIGERAKEWERVLENKAEYSELVREIKAKEPARKVKQKEKDEEIKRFIVSCCTESKQKITSSYTSVMNEDFLTSLIERRGIRNKKDDKQDFATMINELVSEKIRAILFDESSQYSGRIDEYLKDYSNALSSYSDSQSIKIKFDLTNSFALGLASLGVLGASATWLATSFTAWSALVFGPMFGLGPILAVGGVIGIAIGAVIAGVISVVRALIWKKDLANSIIGAYNKECYMDKVFVEVDKYWKDTQSSFSVAAKKVEDDWQSRICEYEAIADERSILVLQAKLSAAYKGLDFFMKIPMLDIGYPQTTE